MTRIIIVVEGKTEAAFVNRILAPALGHGGVYASARVLGSVGQKGGRVTLGRVRDDVSALLKQEPATICTTLLDYYGLGSGFPRTPPGLPARQAVGQLESAIGREIVASVPALVRADARFIPHLQLHEFEALLFSDPTEFARAINRTDLEVPFTAIRQAFPTPEEIDNDPQGAPSKRVLAAHPSYRKVFDGTEAAKAVGLAAMRRECPHFRQWIETLETLSTP